MKRKKSLTFSLILIFFWGQLLAPVFNRSFTVSAQVQDQVKCEEEINKAQKEYYDGRFDEAIDLIKNCLKKGGLTEREREKAYKILTQALIAKGFTSQAKQVIKKMLEITPQYSPTIEQEPPQFVELVSEVKSEAQIQKIKNKKAKKTNGKKWLWIGAGGVVIAGAAAILIAGGSKSSEEKDKTLSSPPDWPE